MTRNKSIKDEISELEEKFLIQLAATPFVYRVEVLDLETNEETTHFIPAYDIDSAIEKVQNPDLWIQKIEEIGMIELELT